MARGRIATPRPRTATKAKRDRESGRQSNPDKTIVLSDKELEQVQSETDIKVLKQWAESTIRKLRLKAAMSENTPKAILKRLQDDTDNQVAKAAKTNPTMHESDEAEMLKLAKSVKKPTRLKLATNPNATPRVILTLIGDSDHEVASTAAKHPNIDKIIFQSMIDPVDGLTGLHSQTFTNFFNNPSFKKEWLPKFIEHMVYVGNYTIPMKALEDNRFFSNDAEWIEVYEMVKKADRKTSGSAWGTFWYSFFLYPKKNYSEEIILTILNDYGIAIKTNSPGTFNTILNTPMYTPAVRKAIYELTGKEEYLPQIAKDVFIF